MKFQYLSIDQVNAVLDACEDVENERRRASFGTEMESRFPASATFESACNRLSATLAQIPDSAIIELQALVWAGRGNFDGNLSENLDYSKTRFDSTTRDYLAAKSQLREYIQIALHTTGVVLQD